MSFLFLNGKSLLRYHVVGLAVAGVDEFIGVDEDLLAEENVYFE